MFFQNWKITHFQFFFTNLFLVFWILGFFLFSGLLTGRQEFFLENISRKSASELLHCHCHIRVKLEWESVKNGLLWRKMYVQWTLNDHLIINNSGFITIYLSLRIFAKKICCQTFVFTNQGTNIIIILSPTPLFSNILLSLE